MTLAAAALTESVKTLALELGFDLVAVGSAGPPEHGPAFRRWLEAGHAGTMGYLERRPEERLDPARVLPGARPVVCVALNYFQGDPDDVSWWPVARYAWGRDYHDVIGPRLERLAEFLAPAGGAGSCGIGSWGGRCPSLAPYVTVMGPTDGATAAGGRSCRLPSRNRTIRAWFTVPA